MKNYKSRTFGLILLAALVSCGGDNSSQTSYVSQEDSKINETTPAGSTTVTRDIEINVEKKVNFAPDFSNLDEFKENINNYIVTFLPKTKALAGADISCKKNFYTQKPQDVTGKINAYAEATSLELTINQDDPHKIEFSCEASLIGETFATHRGRLLKSFVVSGEKNWSHFIGSESEIDTLVLENSSVLYGRYINVNLKAKKLISNHGRIATFLFGEEDTTLDDHDGFSGGKIKINADEAHGTIAFDLRGLNGGKRTKKPEKREPLPRDPKLDGQCPGRLRENYVRQSVCTGKNGHKGLKGLTGFPGLTGGDSGSLELKIINNSLEIAVHYYPGRGSEGGEGGDGGLGSPGGRGNKVEIIPMIDGPICPQCRIEAINSKVKFPDGKPGQQGDKGDRGSQGQDGRELESTIIIGDTKETIKGYWKNN